MARKSPIQDCGNMSEVRGNQVYDKRYTPHRLKLIELWEAEKKNYPEGHKERVKIEEYIEELKK